MGPHQVAALCFWASGFDLQNTLAWVKSASWDGVGPVEGHAKPINSPRFVNDCFELVFHLTKHGDVPLDRLAVGVPFADASNLTRGTRGKHGNVRCRGNVLAIPYQTIKSREADRPHPASYPPALAEHCFRLHGLSRIKKTCDPFSGLGSTARASRKLGLAHVGIELSAEDVVDARRLLAEDERGG
jgi:site-specific DNA-methyltransferase (adenine-specific)